ncbi:type II glyceraldehyde-3-phosphate dehydrogenase [Candidatus Woesearchaeota archaeon]|nr:type II glyceraldehyde-3-phosphate dehydrogenase [Candidatus Woesearchaeota archaeon]
MIKIGLIGYGTIGKRVADAILLQKDMELVGIAANSYNYRVETAVEKGIPIYSSDKNTDTKSIDDLRNNKINTNGNFNELLGKLDIIVDCTPKKIGRLNKELYTKLGIKAIYQGGEKADIGQSFVAQCNYAQAINKQNIRVVSCNTTGLARTINAVNLKYPIKRVRATLIRRAADPSDSDKGPINSVVPSFELPSHHGPDVRTVLPNIEVFTTAVVIPTTLMHMHTLSIDLIDESNKPTKEDILEIFNSSTRIRVIKTNAQITSTADIMEYAKDLGNKRGDMMEICVWDNGIGVHGKEIFFMQAIHQESDVIPENIDAIRAAIGFEDAEESIKMTNKSLGLK